ncbi:transcription factor bHLH112-like isoform X2 [Olea europaea var. sylvestris]|uniref:transcription factor bHLH112-like isoform X2 n=1 Tax=Olea europaea var. sylvestris TaxID=158386 RepID=UPI000C1CD3D7|nr:transcription factor bHLH112-like isoform X2 [Olea europaea var. sylvestris]
MAEECHERTAAATSSSLYNWLPDLHASSLSSWSTNNPWSQQNNSSNSSGEEDISMFTTYTNVSNQSGFSVESSHRLVESVSTNELVSETGSDNHSWSHLVLNGCNGDLQNSKYVGENLLDEFSSKNLPVKMFDPQHDYLKKMDNEWDLTNFRYLNCTNKQLNESSDETERLNKLSNSFCNQCTSSYHHQFGLCSCNTSLSSVLKNCGNSLMSSRGNMDKNFSSILSDRNSREMKVENIGGGSEATGTAFPRLFSSANEGSKYQMTSIKNTAIGGDHGRYHSGLNQPDNQWNNTNKPWIDINSSKSDLETLNLSDSKKRLQQTSYPSTIATSSTDITRSNVRAQRIRNHEGKKKRSEESSGTCTVAKKPMLQHPTVSSTKTQAPKVKLTDKITVLQQIVSPFGKTDTASVLWEAICYIRFLQEQIQLLSNPYMKNNSCKDPWGGLDMVDMEVDDLKSRGLCLVPISWAPQIYGDNNGSDYFAPPYRGCLYR